MITRLRTTLAWLAFLTLPPAALVGIFWPVVGR